MTLSTDVLVVGAGPTGTALAASLRQMAPHLDVLVIDKEAQGRDKTCGDALSPGVVQVLREIDALHILDATPPVDRVRITSPSGHNVEADLGDALPHHDAGYVVRRTNFDSALLDHAREAGAATMMSTELRSFSDDGRCVLAEVEDADGQHVTVRAGLLVGADGAYSRVRRLAAIPEPADRYLGVAIRGYADPDDGSVLTDLLLSYRADLLPAYGWVFPTPDGAYNIGLGITQKYLRRHRLHLPDLLQQYVSALRSDGIHLTDPTSVRAHRLIHGYGLPRIHDGRTVLLGDAACMMNSLTGEGIYYGMAAGVMLARHVARAQLSAVASTLNAFADEFSDRFRSHYRSNLLALSSMGSPRWAEACIRSAGTDATVRQAALELMFGEGTLTVRPGLKILRQWVRL